MTTDNEKTTMFLDAINLDAQKRYEKMKSDIDSYISSELQKARISAKEKVKVLKKTELDRLVEENNAELSELEAVETKKLLDRRAQITDEIFEKAEKAISDFSESDKYLAFLKSSINNIKKSLGDNTVIILKPSDKQYEDELKGLCAEIKYDSSIKLGGCKAENLSKNLIADDTLETRLHESRQNFYKNSGLSITL